MVALSLTKSDDKYCPRCDNIYPLTEDYFYPARHSGKDKTTWQSYCKPCWKGINKTNKDRRQELRKQQEIIDSYFVRLRV